MTCCRPGSVARRCWRVGALSAPVLVTAPEDDADEDREGDEVDQLDEPVAGVGDDDHATPSAWWWSCPSPRTVLHESRVMRRITTVIASPISGSATCRPAVTAAALATTARLTYAS